MTEEIIRKYLKYDANIHIFDEISSSNTVAKELALEGAKEGTIVIALTQTNGRGRLGRGFISNCDNGLYMSIILRPDINPDECVSITVMASVAVLEAIEKTANISAQIKWVNDIYINERKICGILTEAKFSKGDRLDYVICGIGINITPPQNGFNDEIKDIAGAIFANEAPLEYKEKLLAKIIDNFFKHYNDKKDFMNTYREKSSIIGKDVDVYCGNSIISGIAVDINDNAELVVKKEDGEICVFNSGEARVRKSGEKLNDK